MYAERTDCNVMTPKAVAYPKDAWLLFPGYGLIQKAVWWVVALCRKVLIWGIVVWYRVKLRACILIWLSALSRI